MGGLEVRGLPSNLRATEMEVRVMLELVIAILNLVAAILQFINWLPQRKSAPAAYDIAAR
ncbi:hypothetical protein D5081_14695 [Pectobacterium carotovorum]|nr:hypothetical protein D5081_14695 [Pectobacterium carotovorum]RJL39517.1 hypothetical protein D5083_14450 [Pectobacterium carotovorum]